MNQAGRLLRVKRCDGSIRYETLADILNRLAVKRRAASVANENRSMLAEIITKLDQANVSDTGCFREPTNTVMSDPHLEDLMQKLDLFDQEPNIEIVEEDAEDGLTDMGQVWDFYALSREERLRLLAAKHKDAEDSFVRKGPMSVATGGRCESPIPASKVAGNSVAKGRKLPKKLLGPAQEDFYTMASEARTARVAALASKYGQMQKEQDLVRDMDVMSIDR